MLLCNDSYIGNKMAKTLIDRIKKKVKSIDKAKVQAEIAKLEASMPLNVPGGYQPKMAFVQGYDSGKRYFVCDAKRVWPGGGGKRGDERYVADSGKIIGMAIHRSNGGGYVRLI